MADMLNTISNSLMLLWLLVNHHFSPHGIRIFFNKLSHNGVTWIFRPQHVAISQSGWKSPSGRVSQMNGHRQRPTLKSLPLRPTKPSTQANLVWLTEQGMYGTHAYTLKDNRDSRNRQHDYQVEGFWNDVSLCLPGFRLLKHFRPKCKVRERERWGQAPLTWHKNTFSFNQYGKENWQQQSVLPKTANKNDDLPMTHKVISFPRPIHLTGWQVKWGTGSS